MGICACNHVVASQAVATVNTEEKNSTKEKGNWIYKTKTTHQEQTPHHSIDNYNSSNHILILYILIVFPQSQEINQNGSLVNNTNNQIKKFNNSTIINQNVKCVDPQTIQNKTNINVIILGATKVGKSAFLIKITENIFEKLYIPTIYVENQIKNVNYNNKQYTLNFTVTATGDYKEDYTSVYNGMNFFLVFYDVTNIDSFNESVKLYNRELKYVHMHYNYEVSNIFFIGNKIDETPREVSIEKGEEFCDSNKIKLFEISVKTHHNINQMLQCIVHTFDLVAFSDNNIS